MEDADGFGDAYEYLISQFASGAGKKAGELTAMTMGINFLIKIDGQK